MPLCHHAERTLREAESRSSPEHSSCGGVAKTRVRGPSRSPGPLGLLLVSVQLWPSLSSCGKGGCGWEAELLWYPVVLGRFGGAEPPACFPTCSWDIRPPAP
ncbi:hypothetical protein NDU88_004094 [Pleurodeles waltl]|uniref:Uncharacterized protein n=1 Tax=Pleurodeles waltl TaxID=8319 RepID=A0AAV7M8W7_PLEWA|nr:hypothetical protein NDU88_004094 [Pleurodeles waltl]